MKVGDLVKYVESSCYGCDIESSMDILEFQKEIAGLGIIIAADLPLHVETSQTVVVWWPKLGEVWEPVDILEVVSES